MYIVTPNCVSVVSQHALGFAQLDCPFNSIIRGQHFALFKHQTEVVSCSTCLQLAKEYLLSATLFWQSSFKAVLPATCQHLHNNTTWCMTARSSCTPCDFDTSQKHLFQEGQCLHSQGTLSHWAHYAYIHGQTMYGDAYVTKGIYNIPPKAAQHCLVLYMLNCQALTVRRDGIQVFASTLDAFTFLILSLQVSSSIRPLQAMC